MNWDSLQRWVTTRSLVRRMAEAVLAAAGRRHLAQLDRLAPSRCQRRILFGLINKAQATRFGRDHDFRRIRSIADYRRVVPLRSRAELWREYGEDCWGLQGIAAQVRFSLQALSRCHRSALRTALALAVQARPRVQLLSGALLFVTDEGPSNRTDRLPALLRPYTIAGAETEAERFADLPVTGLFGPAERLLMLMEQIKQVRGKRCLRDIWPRLSVLCYTRRPLDMPAQRMRMEAGEDALLLEMVGRAEGPIALEDPLHGLLRLLFDHGVYFEFVPPDQSGEPRCPRFGIEEIELGVPYELALTSPAGLWSCRSGRTVCLERRTPPLLRVVETAIRQPTEADLRRPARRTDLVLSTIPEPEPHPQSAGSAEAPPESAFHSPWSAVADRG